LACAEGFRPVAVWIVAFRALFQTWDCQKYALRIWRRLKKLFASSPAKEASKMPRTTCQNEQIATTDATASKSQLMAKSQAL